MTIGPDDYCRGEYPPLCASDFPRTAPGVVDALPASDAGGSLDALLAENDELRAETIHLRNKLATAQQQRDNAQTQLAHYQRQGW